MIVTGTTLLVGVYNFDTLILGEQIAANPSQPFDNDIAGTLTLGANSSLTVGGLTTIALGTLTLDGGATLDAGPIAEPDGVITVIGALSHLVGGATTLGAAASTFAPSLGATDGGTIQLASVATATSGTVILAVDAASAIEIGSAGGAAHGAVSIDPGATLTANTATVIAGALIDNGNVALTGATLSISGSLGGNGTLTIGAGAGLQAAASIGAGLTIDFAGAGASLATENGARLAATIAGFAIGDTILLDGIAATGASWSGGTLTVTAGSATLGTLSVTGAYGGEQFFASPTADGGTAITLLASSAPSGTVAANTSIAAWTGASGGAWASAANWSDGGAYPGAQSPVTISGTGDTVFTVITGSGAAASTGITGLVSLAGSFHLGSLDVGSVSSQVIAGVATPISTSGELLIGGGATVFAGTVELQDGALLANGGQLTATGAFIVGTTGGGGTRLTITEGALLQAASLAVAGEATITLDAASSLEVGFAGGAASGALTVDAGQTMTVNASTDLAGNLVDQGEIAIAGATLTVAGTLSGGLSGNGVITLGTGAALVADDLTAANVGFAFAGSDATLTIGGVATLDPAISGFSIGDTLVIAGVTATGATWIDGQLTLQDSGTAVARLAVAGSYSPGTFAVTTTASGAAVIFLPPPASVPPADFAATAKSALLWQNINGAPAIWLMNGFTPGATVGLANPGTTWQVVTAGDFTGDGEAAILWQNNDGEVGIWAMNGITPVSTGIIADPGPTWHVVGTGDFNDDGKSDILFQNDNGQAGIWEISGTSIIAGASLANPGTSWHAIGTGDFNGDGYSDILWQNDDGMVGIWEMDGLTPIATSDVANPSPTWHAVATGDFNGDGRSDILFQNDNGAVAIWEMNGFSIAALAQVGNPGPGWHVVGSGDYNGDGDADILLQNDVGTAAIWEMNGLSLLSSATVANVAVSWQTVGSGDLHFINGTQSSGTLAATILNDDFVFTSSLPGLHVITGFDAIHDVLILSAAQFGSAAGVSAAETVSGSSLVLNLGGGSQLLLQGVSALQSKNFHLV